jgi:rare lipoprotein A
MDRVYVAVVASLLVLGLSPLAAQSDAAAHELEGIASWYGGKFQGRLTANGEIFDTNQLTAAHKTLPFGTLVRVLNPANDTSVVVRINDRGPFVDGRVIDLSRAAAEKIGLSAAGVAPVIVEIVHLAVEPTTRTIQVASFSLRTNATALAARLEAHGFHPAIENIDPTIHRVLLQDVPIPEIDDYRTRLATLGYQNVLVRSR